MASIKPLGDRVLVRPKQQQPMSKGGIALPPSNKEKPQEGEVIAVGEGKKTDEGKVIPLSVKPGDKILFTKYGPTEVKVDGEELYILDERDILAIFTS